MKHLVRHTRSKALAVQPDTDRPNDGVLLTARIEKSPYHGGEYVHVCDARTGKPIENIINASIDSEVEDVSTLSITVKLLPQTP